MHAHSYLKSAVQILNAYKGEVPFAAFLKKYFQQSKKYGSKDRKHVSHLCYCYFRLGKALMDIPVEERILTGLFLCSGLANEMLEELRPEWNNKAGSSVSEKLFLINYPLPIMDLFPWKEELSDGIDNEKFCESFFIQPDLFLRIRPGNENTVKTKLADHGIRFSEFSSTCLALPNASKIENIIELDTEAVVQDYASQQTGSILQGTQFGQISGRPKVWDCCAGSGGKSLMAYDIDPGIELTVSDVRESILVNLRKRFAKAGIRNYKSFLTDLTRPNPGRGILSDNHQTLNFDLVICDAPCTGSGTWSRTPEQLYYFDHKRIGQYASLQKKIVSNIIQGMKSNGFLLYITCSVFKEENEEVVAFIKNNFGYRPVRMELLKGYEKKADTMFAALLTKKSIA